MSTAPRLFLHLDSAAPDTIGFALVNGYYGPGSWAGWFLFVCYSWYTLLRSKSSTVDLSTISFALPLNAIAIDHFHHLKAISALKLVDDPSWTQHGASLGAAFTVLFWGLLCMIAQGVVVLLYPGFLRVNGARGIILLIGSVLPAASLAAAAWMLDVEMIACIPALYWPGMYNSGWENNMSLDHWSGYALATTTGTWLLFSYACLATYLILWFTLSDRSVTRSVTHLINLLPRSWMIENPLTQFCLCLLAGTLVLVVFMTCLLTGHEYVAVVMVVMSLFCFLMIAVFSALWLGVGSIALIAHVSTYLFAICFSKKTSITQSCFFMPCAPQSITELDQAIDLCTGLFILGVMELMGPYLGRVWRLWKGGHLSERESEYEGDYETSIPEGEELPELYVQNGPSPSRQSDSSNRPLLQRVGSGYVVEEGRAGQQRTTSERVQHVREVDNRGVPSHIVKEQASTIAETRKPTGPRRIFSGRGMRSFKLTSDAEKPIMREE